MPSPKAAILIVVAAGFQITASWNPLLAQECNNNAIPDACDIAAMISFDCNANGVPDECERGSVMPQEECQSAMLVIPGVTYIGTTASATPDGASSCASSNGSPDVWFKYTPQTNGGLYVGVRLLSAHCTAGCFMARLR